MGIDPRLIKHQVSTVPLSHNYVLTEITGLMIADDSCPLVKVQESCTVSPRSISITDPLEFSHKNISNTIITINYKTDLVQLKAFK